MAIKLSFILIFLIIDLLASCSLTNAQKKIDNGMTKDFKIDATKPSVFLTFEKFGETKSKGSNTPTKVTFLKLHNNTIFPIAVDANFDTRFLQSETLTLSDGTAVPTIPDNSLVEVCFDVDVIPYTTSIEVEIKNPDKRAKNGIVAGMQRKKENPAENDKTTCFWRNAWKSDEFGDGDRIWIKPKQSFIFGVPSNYLEGNLKVSTLFSYEWEFSNGKLNFDEPKHKVYFYGSDVPK